MKLTFIGADHEVTGSCHMLTVGDKNIIVDCGMEQGPDYYVNQQIPVKPSDIDAILVTHAHIDHTGLIPLLVKNGFKGPIYSTAATAQLCKIMLQDSAHIQEFEAEWKNRKARRAGNPEVEPMYTVQDALDAAELFIPSAYGAKVDVCADAIFTSLTGHDVHHTSHRIASVKYRCRASQHFHTFCHQCPSHPIVKSQLDIAAYQKSLEEKKQAFVGQQFIDLEEADPDGKMHKLSEYVGKGKWVLVDFWASWCGPCKAEMPNVVAAYEKYHDKGFDIVGLSFDNKKEPWVKDIAELKMPWTHLSDLKGWNTVASEVYGVNSIPDNLLIDPQGKIVARGLRAQALQDKLKEIFE